MSKNILTKINSIPPLDNTIIEIQRICSDKNRSVNDLSKMIEKDPVLTANILRSRNSPLYGFSREIKNPLQAISLFGMSTIRGFALSSAIKKNISIDLSPYGINRDKFLEISNLQSVLSFKWYSKINRSMLEVIQPASFMMELGKIIIANEIIELGKTNEFKEKILKCNNSLEISNLEKEYVGITNEEVTAKIFEKWNLEESIENAILYSNNPLSAPKEIQRYSIALKIIKNSINFLGIFNENSLKESFKTLEDSKMDKNLFEEIVKSFQNNEK